MFVFCRKYAAAQNARAGARAAFKQAYRERYGRREKVIYTLDLNPLSEFAEWLKVEVEKANNSVEKPILDVYQSSKLPEPIATGYRAMYAHRMHLRIRGAEEEKITCDSGVAAVVWERRRSRNVEVGDKLLTAEYVGWVEEIIELNYRSHCCIVLLCSWIPGSQDIMNAKVERDRYGFVVGNFSRPMHVGPKSFTFPTQCQQVFFSNDEKLNVERGGDWKVVCGTNVRGRRGNLDMYRANIEMLALGRDEDFDGLKGL